MGVKALFKNTWYAWWYYHGKIDRRLILVDTINRHDLGGNMLQILRELMLLGCVEISSPAEEPAEAAEQEEGGAY